MYQKQIGSKIEDYEVFEFFWIFRKMFQKIILNIKTFIRRCTQKMHSNDVSKDGFKKIIFLNLKKYDALETSER